MTFNICKPTVLMLFLAVILSSTAYEQLSGICTESKNVLQQSECLEKKSICDLASNLLLKLEECRLTGNLNYFQDKKAAQWVVTLLASGNSNRIAAADALAKMQDASTVPEILYYLDASIHEGYKTSSADESVVAARVAFQKSAVIAVESLLHEELLNEKVFEKNELGLLDDEARLVVSNFIRNANSIWNLKFQSVDLKGCRLANFPAHFERESLEKELLACPPKDVTVFCGIDDVVAAYEIYIGALPYTSPNAVQKLQEQGINSSNALNYLEQYRAAMWLANLLKYSPNSETLERLRRIGDPEVIPDVLTALEKNINGGYTWNQNLGSYQNWGAFQSLAIRTVEELLGTDLVDEEQLVKQIFPKNDLKPEARAEIQKFIERARQLWEEKKTKIEK